MAKSCGLRPPDAPAPPFLGVTELSSGLARADSRWAQERGRSGAGGLSQEAPVPALQPLLGLYVLR